MSLRIVKDTLRSLKIGLLAFVTPGGAKGANEFEYWKWRKDTEGTLGNSHYEFFFTEFFGIPPGFYEDKRILDIGCGPRGSLEWATMASERVGIDPLADMYLKLGANRHSMKYVKSPSERMPFGDHSFDVVSSFNSLDHVDDFHRTAAEIERVIAPGGLFLLVVEVNHPPTPTEPVSLSWNVTEEFQRAFDVMETRRYEIGDHDIYGQLRRDARFNDDDPRERPGILVAKLLRRADEGTEPVAGSAN